jgi:hypothetical protein
MLDKARGVEWPHGGEEDVLDRERRHCWKLAQNSTGTPTEPLYEDLLPL